MGSPETFSFMVYKPFVRLLLASNCVPVPLLRFRRVEIDGLGTQSLRNTGRAVIGAVRLKYSKHNGGCVQWVGPRRKDEPASFENNEAETKVEETAI